MIYSLGSIDSKFSVVHIGSMSHVYHLNVDRGDHYHKKKYYKIDNFHVLY